MLITPEWMQMMARYNGWQNGWVVEAANTLTEAQRLQNRGAFFRSIGETLGHVLWGDLLWMSRFDGGDDPQGTIANGPEMFAKWDDYRVLRAETDRRIEHWANDLNEVDCTGDISWYSGAVDANLTKSRGLLFTHFFNHQTHHRGQVHAMLTAAGVATQDTDLAFMHLA